MYESHYGLKHKPFSIVPNPEILFLGKNYENALTYMEYGLKERVGFILLTGEIGSGKTTLVRYMLNIMDSKMDIAVIFNTNFSPDQLFRRILSEFDVPCNTKEKEQHLELLYQYLIDRYAHKRHTLLIIDEAQNLSDDALEDIRMLSNLQTDDQILLQIMLVGQPELKKRLNSASFRQLAQRIAVSYHLPPLSENQTRAYIAYRLETAGGAPDLFSPEAVKLIYDSSGGIPRTINLLCDAALVYGYGAERDHVDADIIEQVLSDGTALAAVPLAQEQDPEPLGTLRPPSTLQPDDLPGRLAAVESTVADLRSRQERLLGEVDSRLLAMHQKLITAERERYDQLMEKYLRLLQEQPTADPRFTDRSKTVRAPDGGAASSAPPPLTASSKKPSRATERGKTRFDSAVARFSDSFDRALETLKKMNPVSAFQRRGSRIQLKPAASEFFLKLKSSPIASMSLHNEKRLTRNWLFWALIAIIPLMGLILLFDAKAPAPPSPPSAVSNDEPAVPRTESDTTWQTAPQSPPLTGSDKNIDALPLNETVADREEPNLSAPPTGDATAAETDRQPVGVQKSDTFVRHTIQSGETLMSISRQYGVSVDTIMRANDLANHLIYPGQTLRIPVSG